MPLPAKTNQDDKTKTPDPKPAADPNALASAPAVEFAARYLGKTKPKVEPEAYPSDPDEKPEPKPKAKAAPKAKPEPEADPQPAFDEEKLGAAIADGIAKATKREEPEKKEPESNESPEDQRRIKVLKQMEENNPRQYKGLAERYNANLRKLREYAKKWEKDNPGETFDEDDEAHKEFREQLEKEVEYDDDDYFEAMADLKVAERLKKVQPDDRAEKLEKRLSEFERKEKLREETPKIATVQAQAGNEFWRKLGDDFKDVVTEQGQINPEALKSIQEKDEDEYAIVVRAAQESEYLAAETYKLDNGLVAFNPNDPAHNFLSQFAIAAEKRMSEQPAEKQRDADGRKFVTKAEYNKLPPEKQAKVWTFTADDLNLLLARDYAKKTKAKINEEREKFQRRAKKMGLLDEPVKPAPKSQHPFTSRLKSQATMPDSEPEDDGKPVSPTTPAVPRVAPLPVSEEDSSKNPLESWVSRSIRGK